MGTRRLKQLLAPARQSPRGDASCRFLLQKQPTGGSSTHAGLGAILLCGGSAVKAGEAVTTSVRPHLCRLKESLSRRRASSELIRNEDRVHSGSDPHKKRLESSTFVETMLERGCIVSTQCTHLPFLPLAAECAPAVDPAAAFALLDPFASPATAVLHRQGQMQALRRASSRHYTTGPNSIYNLSDSTKTTTSSY